jgi:uncharacterized protein
MLAVDTNVLLYAVHRGAVEHARCRELVERWRGEALPWYTTWSVVYEFLRVSSHPRVFAQPLSVAQAWSCIEALRMSRGFGVLTAGPRHAEVAARTFGEMPELRGNLLHDAHTAMLMREHGIRRK